MSTSPAISISDPERIRALAHPLRLELLDHLGAVGEATATECAQHTGESVASCSFHLRMLAKYGYIERAPRRGREKPWRLVDRGHDLRPAADVPGSLAAIGSVGEIVVLREAERIRRFFALMGEEDDAWVQASTMARSDQWVTLDEFKEMATEVQAILVRYIERNRDASLRPDGARRVKLFAAFNPEPTDRGST